MKASIIKIGNSKGIRIPKKLLEEAKLSDKIIIELRDEGILLRADKEPVLDEWAMLGYSTLAKDWLRPEEDEAWKIYQREK